MEILNSVTDCDEIQFMEDGSWCPMKPKKETPEVCQASAYNGLEGKGCPGVTLSLAHSRTRLTYSSVTTIFFPRSLLVHRELRREAADRGQEESRGHRSDPGQLFGRGGVARQEAVSGHHSSHSVRSRTQRVRSLPRPSFSLSLALFQSLGNPKRT